VRIHLSIVGLAIVVALFQSVVAQTRLCPPCEPLGNIQHSPNDVPPIVSDEPGWAVGPKGINAVAWQQSQSRPLGQGATILQIDTGVLRNHPLLFPFAGDGGVDLSVGNGLFAPNQTNDDPLLGGFLRNPGHGTKAASVIVARQSGAFVQVVGAAPGARLIPIRATEGVFLSPTRLGLLEAEPWRVSVALNEAAKGTKGRFGVAIDVISMSLGTYPETAALCTAVENAVRAGIIVVAAAGNQVRNTKYPARCPGALAIGGSTYYQAPWKHSAGSADVVVSAPAEGVWTAAVVNGVPCVEASSGTSFATALVASMAAEWTAYRRSQGITDPQPGETLRELLRSTARPWQGGRASQWMGRYGAGIADLDALMRATARLGGRAQ
jgi:subtilisin family serine protease